MSRAGFCQYMLQWTGPTGPTGSCWSPSQWHSDIITVPGQVLVLHIGVTASLTVCCSAVFSSTRLLAELDARLSFQQSLWDLSHSFCCRPNRLQSSFTPSCSLHRDSCFLSLTHPDSFVFCVVVRSIKRTDHPDLQPRHKQWNEGGPETFSWLWMSGETLCMTVCPLESADSFICSPDLNIWLKNTSNGSTSGTFGWNFVIAVFKLFKCRPKKFIE